MAETVWKSKLFWVCRPAMRKTALCCDALQQRAVEILPVFPGKRYGSHNVSRINRGGEEVDYRIKIKSMGGRGDSEGKKVRQIDRCG